MEVRHILLMCCYTDKWTKGHYVVSGFRNFF
jgi:hypothetical protein